MSLNSHDLHEELEHDAFVEGALKGAEFVNRNKLPLTIALVVLLALAFAGAYFVRNHQLNESRAQVLMNRGVMLYGEGEFDAASTWFERVTSEYAGTSAGEEAAYYTAALALRKGELEQARTAFEAFIAKGSANGFLLAAAHGGVAATFEREGNWKSAAEAWQKAANTRSEQNFNQAQQLFNAALCWEKAGEAAKAKSLVDRLLEEYPTSSLKSRAEVVQKRLDTMM